MSIEDEERKIKQREYVARYRERNPEKLRAYQKEYRSRPEVKEKHREYQAAWRKRHPEKALEVSRKNWAKHKDEFNTYRRKKYETDPAYRKQKYDAEQRYKASGGRKQVLIRGRKKNIARTDRWRRNNPDKVAKFRKRYRKNVWIHEERRRRKELDDRYVVQVIKKSVNYTLKTPHIPKELIEIERLKIKTIRQLKIKTT